MGAIANAGANVTRPTVVTAAARRARPKPRAGTGTAPGQLQADAGAAGASLLPVARLPVAELSTRTAAPGALARTPTGALAIPAGQDAGLDAWADRVPMAGRPMVLLGTAVALLGAALAAVNPLGLLGVAIFGGMMTLGGGTAVIGMRKLMRPAVARPPAPSTDPAVMAERARRVMAVLGHAGPSTFERILAQLRWTDKALVETLVALRDSGAVIEDLDLDSGEWVYRVSEMDAVGTPMSRILEERRMGTERA